MVSMAILLSCVLFVSPQLAVGEGDEACMLQHKTNVQGVSSKELNAQSSAEVKLAPTGSQCEEGLNPILSEAACWAAMDRVGYDHYNWDADYDDYYGSWYADYADNYGGVETDKNFPPGCYYEPVQEATWFNNHPKGAYNLKAKAYCAKDFDVTNAELLFVGDSDIDYWRDTSIDFPGSFNIGIGGSTCEQWVNKVDWVVAEFQPKTVLLVCGENDLNGNSVETTFNNFKKIAKTFLDSGARVLYLGTKPEPSSKWFHKKHNAYDALIRAYVENVNSQSSGPSKIIFVDVNPSFYELGNPKSLYAADNLHMGPEGYGKWVTWAKLALDDMGSNELGCWLWQNGRCVSGSAVILGSPGNECPSDTQKITDEAACKAAAGAIDILAPTLKCKESCGNPGWEKAEFTAWKQKKCAKSSCKGCSPCRVPKAQFNGVENDARRPSGCYYCKRCAPYGTWFNEHETGSASGGAKSYCVKK